MIRRLTPQNRLPGMAVLSLWRLGDPTRATAARPFNWAGLYCRSRFYFCALRRLVDDPTAFPRLTVQSVFRDEDCHASEENRAHCLAVRISASFPATELCALQGTVGRRLRGSFDKGIVALHHPQLQVNNFAHPPVYKGRFRIYIRLLPECLGLCATPQPPLQPAGLLASALERVRQRSQTDGYDVQAALSVWLPGPRAIPFWFPEHLHLLGSYELRGRNAEIVRRDFENVPPEEAYRFLGFTLGSTSTPGAWRAASAAFQAAGGLAAGLQYPFLGYRLMTAYHTITPPPSFFTHMQRTAHWKRGIGVSNTHSMTRTWKTRYIGEDI